MKSFTKTSVQPLKFIPFRINDFSSSKYMIIITCICLTLSKGFSQEPSKVLKGELIIQNSQNGEPEVILSAHQQYDVEVFKFPFEEPSNKSDSIENVYSIRYYITNHMDSLNYAKAWFITKDIYDMAKYIWVNDSTVAVRIYNTTTAKADTLQVFKSNNSSGISTHTIIDFH